MSGENTGSIGRARRPSKFLSNISYFPRFSFPQIYKKLTPYFSFLGLFAHLKREESPGPAAYFSGKVIMSHHKSPSGQIFTHSPSGLIQNSPSIAEQENNLKSSIQAYQSALFINSSLKKTKSQRSFTSSKDKFKNQIIANSELSQSNKKSQNV